MERAAAEQQRRSLRQGIERADWGGAARASTQLAELYLVGGDLERAHASASSAVELADRGGALEQLASSRTLLAAVEHRRGVCDVAQQLFREAEAIMRRLGSSLSWLSGVPGFWFCDFLLARAEILAEGWGARKRRVDAAQLLVDEVVARSRGEASREAISADGTEAAVGKALALLSLGRALGLDARISGKRRDASESLAQLGRAVEALRGLGRDGFLASALVARANILRRQWALKEAAADLTEAEALVARSSMELFRVEVELERGWLAMAAHQSSEARRYGERAARGISAIGLHARTSELRAFEECLASEAPRRTRTRRPQAGFTPTIVAA